jgi:hypothetical protein
MSEDFGRLFAELLSNPVLSNEIQELCRSGKIRAEGRPAHPVFEERGPGHFKHTGERIESQFETIPPADWGESSFYHSSGELRLEGWQEYYTPELAYGFKGWRFIRFPKSELAKLDDVARDSFGCRVGIAGMIHAVLLGRIAGAPYSIPARSLISSRAPTFRSIRAMA